MESIYATNIDLYSTLLAAASQAYKLSDSYFTLILATTAVTLVAVVSLRYLVMKNSIFECRLFSPNPSLPPRPLTIPFLGTIYPLLPNSLRQPNRALQRLARKYGPIFRVKTGVQEIIWITSYDLFREANSGKNGMTFAGRSMTPQQRKDNPVRAGILEGDGSPAYIAFRKSWSSMLRNVGFGEATVTGGRILLEYETMRNRLSSRAENIDIHLEINHTTGNVLFTLFNSKTFQRDDPNFNRFIAAGVDTFRVFDSVIADAAWPLRQILPNSRRNRFREADNEINEFLDKEIALRNTKYNQIVSRRDSVGLIAAGAAAKNDFVAQFLNERYQYIKANDGREDQWTLLNLRYVIKDVMLPGFDTTLPWLFFLLLHFSEWQEKLIQHITENIPGEQPTITWEERDKLPLVEAFINETWRWVTINPMSVLPRQAMQSVTLGGYIIPEGASVAYHIWSVQRDPIYWAEPDRFDPLRFITRDDNDEHRTVFKPNERLIVFSAGRRSCFGEQFARKMVFLFFVNVVRDFKLFEYVPHGTKSKITEWDPLLLDQYVPLMYPPEHRVNMERRLH